MAEQEQLFRINFHSKKTGYTMFLLIWGVDAMDALCNVSAIVGPGGEYALDSLSAQMDGDKPVYRTSVGDAK